LLALSDDEPRMLIFSAEPRLPELVEIDTPAMRP
jgi:hypothetical protein